MLYDLYSVMKSVNFQFFHNVACTFLVVEYIITDSITYLFLSYGWTTSFEEYHQHSFAQKNSDGGRIRILFWDGFAGVGVDRDIDGRVEIQL